MSQSPHDHNINAHLAEFIGLTPGINDGQPCVFLSLRPDADTPVEPRNRRRAERFWKTENYRIPKEQARRLLTRLQYLFENDENLMRPEPGDKTKPRVKLPPKGPRIPPEPPRTPEDE